MTHQREKFDRLLGLVAAYSEKEGVNFAGHPNFGTYKVSSTEARKPAVDQPAIIIVLQGQKDCYVGDKKYEYSAGNVLVMLYPMPVEAEIVLASPDSPFLVAGILIALGRMADVLLRIDRIDGAAAKPVATDPSGLFSIPLNDQLLDPILRLFETLEDPRDAAMLGDAIIDEIYYRILCHERGGELRYLLQQRGEIQRISRAVEYIHNNLDNPVDVGQLADMVHMSRTTFYENFREVMHVSPLQYAKSVKLYEAQLLIKDGAKANEAGYRVGYNSPAQFSREYKRHFGYAPSAT